ncbi:hypothetical protein K438DRAFT_1812455 [Mycena galopus ATCC 62051]|nr:hypothetical protein K438DRAFT_1812455 [Mycena galopus ATCC 62051]
MNATPFTASARSALVLEQTERTRQSSKADIERLIEESESKIMSLESQISPLVQLRDRERARVAAPRYLISPIHALPVELLAEVYDLSIRSWTHIEDVFRISQVCSDWRQVVHCTPRLWTGPIEVDLQSRSDNWTQTYTEGLKAWLVRSAPLPVPVTLRLGRGDINHCILEEVLTISGSRWGSLQLRVPSIDTHPDLSVVSRLAECRLDSLEELDLGFGRFEEDVDTSPSFMAVSRLRKLRMAIFSDAAVPILMPWAQLTNLALFCDSPDITLDILAQCPNLIRASARTTGWSVPPGAERDIIALDHLRTLSLPLYGWEGPFTSFFDYLSTPALEELNLYFSEMMGTEVGWWIQAHFTRFQLRAPNITRFDWSYVYISSDDFGAAIRHAPSLTHLQLNYCHNCFDDTLINSLSYKGGVTPLVPRLHHLVLENMECANTFTEDILADMIASRWWTDADLASHSVPPAVARWTRVELRGDFGQHFVDAMEVLQRQGLSVECTSYPG